MEPPAPALGRLGSLARGCPHPTLTLALTLALALTLGLLGSLACGQPNWFMKPGMTRWKWMPS